jgi:Glyoxalase-like domain
MKGPTMPDDAGFLHHVGLITRSMDATIAQYERLGFAFTPLSLPHIVLREGGEPEPLGAGNRTAVFEDNYLEVLAVTDPRRWASVTVEQRGPYDLDRPLARYEGLHVMHFGTGDLEALHARLTAEGVANGGVRPFERDVATPDGPRTMRALALGFPPGANPEGLVQIAQHLTPDLVLQPRHQNHPNGARRLVEVTVCAQDPEAYARKYHRYTGHRHRADREGYTVDLDRSRVRVVAPDQVPDLLPGTVPPAVPSLVGFTVTVADRQAVEKLLDTNAVPYRRHGRGLTVAAQDASGSTVTFEQA